MIVTVAVEPDCSELMVQLTLVPLAPPPQVPDVAVAESNVTGTPVDASEMSSVTTTPVAKSGPLLVTV